MDEQIGKVFTLLDEQGQSENTFVVFLSDNGGSGNGGNAPLRGQKGTLWEGGLRVPFLARWPGHLPAGAVTDEFLTALEIVPTLLAAAGREVPGDLRLDGENMLPTLRGDRPSPRTAMFWQRRSDRAARVDHLKWLDTVNGQGLYDLREDPEETNDLSAQRPEVAQMLRNRFLEWRADMDAAEPRGPFRDY